MNEGVSVQKAMLTILEEMNERNREQEAKQRAVETFTPLLF